MIEGHCDTIGPSSLRGWLVDRSRDGARLDLDILFDDVPVRTIVADLHRDDLKLAGIGDGRHAYEARVPLEALSGEKREVELSLRIRATGDIIPKSRYAIDLVHAPMSFLQLRQMSTGLLHARLAQGIERAQTVTRAVRGTLPATDRIAIVAVNAGAILASHWQVLSELRHAGYAIVIANSGGLAGRSWLDLAGKAADVVVLKEDEGRDFSSWLTAFHLYRAEFESAEHVLFINESLCGPILPLRPVLEKAARSDADFWGLSDSYDVRYHLQSSFFILRRNAITSRPFREFVASYQYPDEKREVIVQGEIGLSHCLISGGLTAAVLCPYEELATKWMDRLQDHIDEASELSCFSRSNLCLDDHRLQHWTRWIHEMAAALLAGEPRNSQHVFWRLMIEEYGYPFIKRELLFVNPVRIPDLSALFGLLSPAARELVLSDMRHLSGRAPPLLTKPKRSVVREAL